MVSLEPSIGDEIKKIRPCLVIGLDALSRLGLRIIVPITEWNESFSKQPWKVAIQSNKQNGLSKSSAIDALQIRSLSLRRFKAKKGEIGQTVLDEVAAAVSLIVGYKGKNVTDM
jgi:mRNA interferase MazF